MNLKQLGIITHLTIPAFIAMFFLGGNSPTKFINEFILMILLLGFLALVGYYCALVSRNEAFDTATKNKWFISLFLFHWVAMIFYWHKYIKPNPRRA